MYTDYSKHPAETSADQGSSDGIHDVIQSFSWKVFPNRAAIKQIDKSVLKWHGSGIPVDIRFFFNADELQPGERILIHLINNHKKYEGYVTRQKEGLLRKSATTRIFWSTKLTAEIQKFYNYHGAFSVLIFKPINEKNTYLVDFDLEGDEKLWFDSPDEDTKKEPDVPDAKTPQPEVQDQIPAAVPVDKKSAEGFDYDLFEEGDEPDKPWDVPKPEKPVEEEKKTEADEIRDLCLEKGLLYYIGGKGVVQNKDKGLEFLKTAKSMGCADASYLLDTENPNGRINLYAALHGYEYARRNLESWQSTAKWRLTSDEWREFYTAFHPEKIEEERKRKEEEERLRHEEEEKKRREEEERLRREEEERKRKEEEERLRREEEERKRKEEEERLRREEEERKRKEEEERLRCEEEERKRKEEEERLRREEEERKRKEEEEHLRREEEERKRKEEEEHLRREEEERKRKEEEERLRREEEERKRREEEERLRREEEEERLRREEEERKRREEEERLRREEEERKRREEEERRRREEEERKRREEEERLRREEEERKRREEEERLRRDEEVKKWEEVVKEGKEKERLRKEEEETMWKEMEEEWKEKVMKKKEGAERLRQKEETRPEEPAAETAEPPQVPERAENRGEQAKPSVGEEATKTVPFPPMISQVDVATQSAPSSESASSVENTQQTQTPVNGPRFEEGFILGIELVRTVSVKYNWVKIGDNIAIKELNIDQLPKGINIPLHLRAFFGVEPINRLALITLRYKGKSYTRSIIPPSMGNSVLTFPDELSNAIRNASIVFYQKVSRQNELDIPMICFERSDNNTYTITIGRSPLPIKEFKEFCNEIGSLPTNPDMDDYIFELWIKAQLQKVRNDLDRARSLRSKESVPHTRAEPETTAIPGVVAVAEENTAEEQAAEEEGPQQGTTPEEPAAEAAPSVENTPQAQTPGNEHRFEEGFVIGVSLLQKASVKYNWIRAGENIAIKGLDIDKLSKGIHIPRHLHDFFHVPHINTVNQITLQYKEKSYIRSLLPSSVRESVLTLSDELASSIQNASAALHQKVSLQNESYYPMICFERGDNNTYTITIGYSPLPINGLKELYPAISLLKTPISPDFEKSLHNLWLEMKAQEYQESPERGAPLQSKESAPSPRAKSEITDIPDSKPVFKNNRTVFSHNDYREEIEQSAQDAELTRKMLEVTYIDEDIRVPEPAPPSPAAEKIVSSLAENITGWDGLKSRLTEVQLQFLKTMLENPENKNELKNLANKEGETVDLLIDKINETAEECIGDIIIEDVLIIEEYTEEIRRITG